LCQTKRFSTKSKVTFSFQIDVDYLEVVLFLSKLPLSAEPVFMVLSLFKADFLGDVGVL